MKDISVIELAKVLLEHKLWDKSDGKEGKRADLSYTDLRMANLWRADLRMANLNGAYLWFANLCGALLPPTLKVHQTYKHTAYIQPIYTQIGCDYHSNKEWHNFTDEAIEIMNPCLTGWWEEHKKTIFALMSEVEKLERENYYYGA